MKLKIKKLYPEAKLPERAHEGDMYDLFAGKDVEIHSDKSTIIPLGIACEIPQGYRLKIYSRSSLPLKKKIIVSNSVGIIDSLYRGELGLICHSLPLEDIQGLEDNCYRLLSDNCIKINAGDKIAQMQIEKIEDFEIEEVEEIDMSNDRGGGFGSTDKK